MPAPPKSGENVMLGCAGLLFISPIVGCIVGAVFFLAVGVFTRGQADPATVWSATKIGFGIGSILTALGFLSILLEGLGLKKG